MIFGVDAARWWGPIGYLYRQCTGNVIAGFLQLGIAAVVASIFWPPLRRAIHAFIDRKLAPLHAHDRWYAELLVKQHKVITGEDAPPHPIHGDLD